jgi:membrane dipeptidase
MHRRRFLQRGLLAGLGLAAGPMLNLGRIRLLAESGPEVSTRAVDLVLESRVIDMLGLLTLDWHKLVRWHRRPRDFGEADYRQLERSGVNVFHPAVETSAIDPYSGAMRWITGWNHLLRSHGCFIGEVDSPADVVALPAQGEIGVVIGFQNSNHFRSTVDVRGFYGLGQRVSQLTYNAKNALGCGCYVTRDTGLTRFGGEVVAAMDDVGMAIDLSHCGERTARDAMAASSRPVLITHSNCEALVPGHPRCKSDGAIRRMAATGGVMGITVVRAFVSHKPNPTIDDVLDHYEHVIRLVGVEHVGIGSDVDVTALDPKTGRPNPFYVIRGLDPVARVFQIADGLLQRGHSARAVQLVLGENFRRALAAIWHRESRAVDSPLALERDPFCPPPRMEAPPVNTPG